MLPSAGERLKKGEVISKRQKQQGGNEPITSTSLKMPIKVKPYQHQQDAYDFACDLFGVTKPEVTSTGCGLLMEMGCGKSLAGLAVMGTLAQFGLIRRALIVCPLSVMGVWKEEMEKYAAYPYSITLLRGTMARKREQLANLPEAELQIAVCNYESMWRLEEELTEYHAGLIIADEGHRLKDGTSRQSRAMHRLGDRAGYRLLLTGTAISGKELDIYSEYRFAAPEVYGRSFTAFRNHYFTMGGYGGYQPIFKKEMLPEYLEKLHSIAYRIRKDECLDLPPITEEVRTVELEPAAAKIYRQIEEESYAALRNSEVTIFNVLTRILRLAQITGGHLTDDNERTITLSTAKLDALADIADTMQAEGRRLVIMARFTAELDDIEYMLREKEIRFAVIRGGTKDREEQVRQFQEEEECRVFVGQIQAAGTGLTLTAASTMVFYSLSFSMGDFDQAKARIHRVSQTEKVHYIYLCCRDTIDSKILKALRNKIDLAKALVDDYRQGRDPFR